MTEKINTLNMGKFNLHYGDYFLFKHAGENPQFVPINRKVLDNPQEFPKISMDEFKRLMDNPGLNFERVDTKRGWTFFCFKAPSQESTITT